MEKDGSLNETISQNDIFIQFHGENIRCYSIFPVRNVFFQEISKNSENYPNLKGSAPMAQFALPLQYCMIFCYIGK